MNTLDAIICTTTMASIAITAFSVVPFIAFTSRAELRAKFVNYGRIADFLRENTEIKQYELGVTFHPSNMPNDTLMPVFYNGKTGYIRMDPDEILMMPPTNRATTYIPREFIETD